MSKKVSKSKVEELYSLYERLESIADELVKVRREKVSELEYKKYEFDRALEEVITKLNSVLHYLREEIKNHLWNSMVREKSGEGK